jgi:ankyrin repeat protein
MSFQKKKMYEVAKTGDIKKTVKMAKKNNLYSSAMAGAAEGGHMDIVELMLEHGATNYDYAMAGAAEGGHMDIVELMLEHGATDFDFVMKAAATRGHMDIVELMLEHGATNYDVAMEDAAYEGHMDIVELMLELGANSYDYAMLDAASGGHMDIVELMLELGANNYDMSMEGAVYGGHMDIVELMLELGATDYDFAMKAAATGGHMDIVVTILLHVIKLSRERRVSPSELIDMDMFKRLFNNKSINEVIGKFKTDRKQTRKYMSKKEDYFPDTIKRKSFIPFRKKQVPSGYSKMRHQLLGEEWGITQGLGKHGLYEPAITNLVKGYTGFGKKRKYRRSRKNSKRKKRRSRKNSKRKKRRSRKNSKRKKRRSL